MNATISLENQIIGTIALQLIDRELRMVGGILQENDFYKSHHQARIRELCENLDYETLEDLDLKVTLENDTILKSSDLIITDIIDEPIEIEISGVDNAVIKEFK
jgi:hypothetical protein